MGARGNIATGAETAAGVAAGAAIVTNGQETGRTRTSRDHGETIADIRAGAEAEAARGIEMAIDTEKDTTNVLSRRVVEVEVER